MNKPCKMFAALIAFLSVSFAVHAEPVSYAFSGFGGGLPSSAHMISEDTFSPDDITLLRSGDSGSGSGKIILLVVGGVLVTALVVGGCILLYKSTVSCAEDSSSACGDSCGDACGDILAQSCSDSLSGATCKASVTNLFSNGFSAIPVYVP